MTWDIHPNDRRPVLKRMLPPNNLPVRQLSQEEGISEATLHKWRTAARGKGQLLPDAEAGPEGWSSRDKFAAVLETAALNEADLATKEEKKRIKELECDLARKDRALAETTALLALGKYGRGDLGGGDEDA